MLNTRATQLEKELLVIAGIIEGNILETPHQHIAFGINTEGKMGFGFTQQIMERAWPKLHKVGGHALGDTISYKADDGKTYHALVCHTLNAGGWNKTPETITACLDRLDVPDDEPIAIVAIGSGIAGLVGGADESLIREGMRRSKKRVVVYEY